MEIEHSAERTKLIHLIEHYFLAPEDAAGGKLFYTTHQVFAKMQSIYPSEEYAPKDVCEVLIYLRFETINGSGDKIFWFMEERSLSF